MFNLYLHILPVLHGDAIMLKQLKNILHIKLIPFQFGGMECTIINAAFEFIRPVPKFQHAA